MIHRLMAAACVFASAAHADPLFQDISAGLPDHHYTGGWEHFVGGGVSAFDCSGDGLPDLDGRKIKVDGTGRTSLDGVWAGGDCASGGDDLTVTAVAEGRDAAMDIHTTLMGAAG